MNGKKIIMLTTIGMICLVAIAAESKKSCITRENLFHAAQKVKYQQSNNITNCLLANNKRHSAQIAYCNTLE